MTYKHISFDASPVMRSLERLAQEKGLIKPPPPIKKEAAAKPIDFTPTDNLMENVLKLCAGLKTQGFVKDAEELQQNFLAYKQAQTLYDVSGEDGKDLIESAHPEGSHKIGDVDSDEALVEDLLERQRKILEVVNKRPQGKLSSKQVLEQVKVAIGARPLV